MTTRGDVFGDIFLVFLGLGTLVGIVVISYMLYNAYKYRDTDEYARADDQDRPTLGELPTGGGGGKKLFVSFLLSAIIVISLVLWTYTWLLYVEAGPSENEIGEDDLELEVHGETFLWHFYYTNEDGEQVTSSNEVVLPEDTTVWLSATSEDVWHTFGVPDQRVKADAIPGEYDETWFHTDQLEDGEERNYTVECFELCGPGHTQMEADMRIVPQEEFEEWLEEETDPVEQEENGDDNGQAQDENGTEDDEGDGDDNATDGGDD